MGTGQGKIGKNIALFLQLVKGAPFSDAKSANYLLNLAEFIFVLARTKKTDFFRQTIFINSGFWRMPQAMRELKIVVQIVFRECSNCLTSTW